MSNNIFPNLATLGWSVIRSPAHQTRIQRSISGIESRAIDLAWALRKWTLTYEVLRDNRATSLIEYRKLLGHFGMVFGATDSFLFFDAGDYKADNSPLLRPDTWYQAIGDGIRTTFQLARPANSDAQLGLIPLTLEPISAPYLIGSIFINGSVTVDYTVDYNRGWIIFDNAPGDGTIITASFEYYWRVRFVEDYLDFENFMYGLWTVKKVELIQVIDQAVTSSPIPPDPPSPP